MPRSTRRRRPGKSSDNPFAGALAAAARITRAARPPVAPVPSEPAQPWRVEGGYVFLFKPPARRIVSSYVEPYDQFNVMLSGSYFATWRHDGRECPIHARAGDVVYWPAETLRTEHNDPNDPMRMLKVYVRWIDRVHERPAIAHDRQRLIIALAQVMLTVENSLLAHRWTMLADYAAAIVSEYVRLTEPGCEDLVTQVVRYTREHIRQSFGLEELARSVGLEKNYFGRRYKEVTGRTPMRDVCRMRVEHAVGLLRAHPDMPLKQVAAQIGMGSCQMLARWLKRDTGLTSRDIRGRGQ